MTDEEDTRQAGDPVALHVAHIERLVVIGARSYLGALAKVGVDGAVELTATLAQMRGSVMIDPHNHSRLFGPPNSRS